MPPPRLLRHLRPCQPPWSTPQIRWASDGPRDTPSNRQGDNLSTAGSSEERLSQAQKKGWWGALLGSVSTLFSGREAPNIHRQTNASSPPDLLRPQPTTAKEPSRTTDKRPSHPTSSSTADRNGAAATKRRRKSKKGVAEQVNVGGQAHGTAPQRSDHPTAQVEPDLESKNNSLGQITIKKHASIKGNQKPIVQGPAVERPHSHKCFHCGQVFVSNRALRRHLKSSKASRLQHWHTLKGTSSGHRQQPQVTQTPSQTDMGVQQQLQQLLEEVRELKAQLQERTASEATSPQAVSRPLSPSVKRRTLESRVGREKEEAHLAPTTMAGRTGPRVAHVPKADPGDVRHRIVSNMSMGTEGASQETTSTSGLKYKLRFRQLAYTDQALEDARNRLERNVRTLRRIRLQLCNMSSPGIVPLVKLFDETHAAFEGHFHDSFPLNTTRSRRRSVKPRLSQEDAPTAEFQAPQEAATVVSGTAPTARDTSSGPSTNGPIEKEQLLHISHKSAKNKFRVIGSQPTDEGEIADLDWRMKKFQARKHDNRGLRVERVDMIDSANIPSQVSEPPVESMMREPQAQARVTSLIETPGADTQRLIRSLHTQANGVKTPKASARQRDTENMSTKETTPTRLEPSGNELSELSLLEELFPEASTYIQPHYTSRNPYPKLDLPNDIPLIRPTFPTAAKTQRQQIFESFRQRSEPVTALQLIHCSTELTDADFRRLIPKGKHIESWVRDGEFQKVIPGRDPLSLERLPFYYLLFKSPESALAYQKNTSRLHKLASLHQPSSIFSAIPPPKGMLEDGEDLNAIMSSYLLQPINQQLNLHMVMQPYNPSLRTLIEQGGYKPIVPSLSEKGEKIWKVLLYIDGWEPSQADLYHIFDRHAYDRGLTWPFHNGEKGILRLRDIIDVRTKLLPVSSARPRAANPDAHPLRDPNLDFLNLDPLEQSGGSKGSINQVVMNKLYNRWIVEFGDEDAARRFARMWNRRVLPSPKFATWRDTEELRMVNAEFLW